jgi:hypothetical protein
MHAPERPSARAPERRGCEWEQRLAVEGHDRNGLSTHGSYWHLGRLSKPGYFASTIIENPPKARAAKSSLIAAAIIRGSFATLALKRFGWSPAAWLV